MEKAPEKLCGAALSLGESLQDDKQEIERKISTQATERYIAVVGSEIGDGANSHNLDEAKMHQGAKLKPEREHKIPCYGPRLSELPSVPCQLVTSL